MKKFLSFAILSLSCILMNAKNTFEVNQCELPKQQLYSNLKTWISKTFESYNTVVDMEDYHSGRIIIKCSFSKISKISEVILYKAYHTIIVDVKDNNYRYAFIDTSVAIEPNNEKLKNTKNLTIKELSKYTSDLEFVNEMCQKYNITNNKMALNKETELLLLELKRERDKNPQYSDDKKTKIDKKWEKENYKYELFNQGFEYAESIKAYLSKSLESNIIVNETW